MTHPVSGKALRLGVDIGQKRDPTALAVVEVAARQKDIASLSADRSRASRGAGSSDGELHYFVRHLERLPLGTPYPEVARRIAQVWRRVKHRAGLPPSLFVDATGVGAPVVDLLGADPDLAAHLWAVTLTYGNRRTIRAADRRICLGKEKLFRYLVFRFDTRCLHLPATSEAKALAAELRSYEIRVDENGTDRYGAFQSGTHDDLVTALGLAVQEELPAASVRSRAPWPRRLR